MDQGVIHIIIPIFGNLISDISDVQAIPQLIVLRESNLIVNDKLPKTILYCQIRSQKPYFVENFLKSAMQSTDRRAPSAQVL